MSHTTTIDEAGRIEIPKEMREELGLEADTPVTIEVRDGVIAIEPKAREIRLVRKGHLLVAEPVEPGGPTLTNEMVEKIRQDLRNRS